MKGQLFSLDAFTAFSILIACLGLFLIMMEATNTKVDKEEILKLWDASQILVKDALVNKPNPNIIITRDPIVLDNITKLFNLDYISISTQTLQCTYGESCEASIALKRPVIVNNSGMLEFGWLEVGVCG